MANLVANALRFPGGRPRGAAPRWTVAGSVTLTVVDHGPGVPAADRSASSSRSSASATAPSGGVGLGLAVARGLTEAMGGSLVASTPRAAA